MTGIKLTCLVMCQECEREEYIYMFCEEPSWEISTRKIEKNIGRSIKTDIRATVRMGCGWNWLWFVYNSGL
jgi:hypothetical protein